MSFNHISRNSRSSLRDARPKDEDPAIEQADNVPAYKHGDAESLHLEKKITISDPVFGDIEQGGPNYRNVGWIGTAFLMIKTQIGIGVLSIPAAFNTLGFVPGIVTLIAVAVITTWSDYVVGCFKLRHLEMYGIDDAGYIMFGRTGREVFAVAFLLYWVFVSGSAILSISIGLNAVSNHATCTAVFVAVAAVATFVLSSIPTLSKMSWLAAAGAISILISILTLTIAVSVQDRPATAPPTGSFIPDTKVIAHPDFAETMSAVATIIFAFSGTPAFFPIVAEMRNPQHYVRSMLICQATVCTVYLVIGVVVYTYCGSYVASPALGSAGPLMKKVCYGLALPGLLVSGTMVSHFPAKYLFVRLLRTSPHLTSPTPTHHATWLLCTSGTVTAAYIIASAVPNFSSLIALIGALLGTFICFQPMGCMWLYDNWDSGGREEGKKGDWRWWGMVGWSCFVIGVGCFCMVGGSYGAVVGLVRDYGGGGGSGGGRAWGCSDNSGSS